MLIKRVISALVAVPLLLYFIYLGDLWYNVIVWLIALLGIREFMGMMGLNGATPLALGFAGVTALMGAVYFEELALILLVVTVIFLLTALSQVAGFHRFTLQESFGLFWGIMYIGGLMSYLVLIRNSFSFEYTMILFAAVWLNDTFAYFAGRKWGNRKLIPAVSPAKTVEGSLGGLLGPVVFMAITFLFMGWFHPLSLEWTLALTVLIIIPAQAGDLVESALKRKLEVKDSGNLIPGHGGILDRFDSMLLAAPVAYYFLLLIGS